MTRGCVLSKVGGEGVSITTLRMELVWEGRGREGGGGREGERGGEREERGRGREGGRLTSSKCPALMSICGLTGTVAL